MEYQSNINSNDTSTASNGAADTAATTRNRPPVENPERQRQQPQTAKEAIAPT